MKTQELPNCHTKRKHRYVFFAFFALFFWGGYNNLNAQACSPIGKNIDFDLTQQNAICSDGVITITLKANNVEATGYKVVSVNVTGPQLFGPHNITGKTTDITKLASGEYTVTLTGYCSSDLNEANKGGSLSKTITVGGNYAAPEIGLTVTRKALAECSPTGEITFDFAKGMAPYKIEVLDGPSRVGDIIGDINKKSYVLGGLKAGNYKFRISDHCRSREEIKTVGIVSDFTITKGSRVPTKIDEDCETLRVLNVSVGEDLAVYLPVSGKSDEQQGYVSFEIYFSDDAEGTINKTQCSFTYTTNHTVKTVSFMAKVPGGYAALRGKFVTLKRIINENCVVFEDLKQTEQISDKDETMRVFYGADPTQIDCNTHGLTIPVSGIAQASVTAFVCTPINYVIKDSEQKKVGDGIFTWEVGPQFHELPTGKYTIEFTDNSGRSWTDTETVDNTHVFDKLTTATISLGQEGRKTTIVDCKDDSDDCHFTFARFRNLNTSVVGMTLKYTQVPDGFYYAAGTEIVIQEDMLINSKTTIQLNSVWGTTESCRLVPGNYTIEVIDYSCLTPKKLTKTFVAYQTQLIDFDYKIRYQCGNAYMSINPQTKVAYNGITYTGGNQLLFGVSSNVNNSQLSLDKTYKKADGSEEILLPISGEYKIVFSSTATGTSVGKTISSNYNVVIRNVNIQIHPFQFADIDTRAYLCPSASTGVVITTRTENGSGQTKFTIYKKNTFGSFVKLDDQTIPAGDLLVFKDLTGEEGAEYKIEAMDDCNELITKGVAASSLKNKLNIAGQLTGCQSDLITIRATYIPGATYEWHFQKKGTTGYIQLGETTNEYSINSFDESTNGGTYKVIFNISGCTSEELTAEVKAAPEIIVWNSQNGSSDWDDANNWYPKGVPAGCTDVYIPGNITVFPSLKQEGGNTCRDIYFLPGAQLGQPQFLNYRNSAVQLDLGMQSGTRKSISKEDFVAIGRDYITSEDRLKLGASYSNESLSRNNWHMLSSPLKGLFSGDYAFGGYPFTYLRKFDVDAQAGNAFTAGRWSNYFASLVEELQPGEGFSYWVNEYKPQMRYLERGVNWTSGMSQTKPLGKDNTDVFGLGEMNGILHFPYYNDSYLSNRHRNHTYNDATQESIFNYFWQSPQTASYYMQLIDGDIDTKERRNASRFIAESVVDGKTTLDVKYHVKAFTNPQGEFVLLGNPYMSALDFSKFQEDNASLIKEVYQLWTGTSFEPQSGSVAIAPMQSFLVELKETAPNNGNLEFNYNVANISTTSSTTSLRSTPVDEHENRIRISMENKLGSTTAQIVQKEDARDNFCDWDISKIIEYPVQNTIPEVYTLTSISGSDKMKGVVINSIQSDDMIIPLGIATVYSGEMKLKLEGMDKYHANISLIDSQSGTIDISGLASFEYPFYYTASLDENGYGKSNEQRFSIRISRTNATHIDQTVNHQLTAYTAGANLYIRSFAAEIKQVSVYSIQGQLLYQRENIHSTTHEVDNLFNFSGAYVVKIHTDKEVKVFKFIR